MPTADPRIRALTDELVADLSFAIHEAALNAVREALDGVPGPGGPRRGRRKAVRQQAVNGRRKKAGGKKVATKATRRGKRVRRSAGDVETTASAILSHVRANPGSSVGDLGEALGLATKDLALPIRKLVADRKLRTEGERRGTRYFAGKGGARKKPAKKASRKKRAATRANRKAAKKARGRAAAAG